MINQNLRYIVKVPPVENAPELREEEFIPHFIPENANQMLLEDLIAYIKTFLDQAKLTDGLDGMSPNGSTHVVASRWRTLLEEHTDLGSILGEFGDIGGNRSLTDIDFLEQFVALASANQNNRSPGQS